jgi:hypothetical protein
MGLQIEPLHQALQQRSVSAMGIAQAHRGIQPTSAPILAGGSAAIVLQTPPFKKGGR